MDRIYLDACCLNRPFDDQTQARIRLESEAVILVLNRCQQGQGEWIGSNALHFEVGRIPDPERRRRVLALLNFVSSMVASEGADFARGRELLALGFKGMDALHVALAEKANCSVLLTTDDAMLRLAVRTIDLLRVRVANPEDWLREIQTA